jgi:hypothetical protein
VHFRLSTAYCEKMNVHWMGVLPSGVLAGTDGAKASEELLGSLCAFVLPQNYENAHLLELIIDFSMISRLR